MYRLSFMYNKIEHLNKNKYSKKEKPNKLNI